MARKSRGERGRLGLRGGVGPSRYAAELLEERRLLTLAVPAYSSLPGAPQTLYLNFGGTAAAFDWNNGTQYRAHGPAGNDDPIPPFDWDANTANFSNAELTAIQQIWSLIAEKFSPFRLNVTTVDPGNLDDGKAEEVIIGGRPTDWYQPGAAKVNSGTSSIGGFTSNGPNIEFLFAAQYPNNPYFVATNAAHEAGHGFGLRHERWVVVPPPVNNNNYPEYFFGDANEAPIMGDAANNTAARGIWWKTNIYGGQNSADPIQDELNVLAGPGGPLSYRFDDFTDNQPGSLSFDGSGTVIAKGGVIEHEGDADPWLFTAATSSASFKIDNGSALGSSVRFGGMLSPNVRIYRQSTGVQVPATITQDAAKQSIVISTDQLAGGGQTYVLEVSGVGGYGDIGQYTITGQVTTPATYFGHVLTVGGVSGNNDISIALSNTSILVTDTYTGGSFTQSFPWSDVGFINVFLGAGNNTVTVHSLSVGSLSPTVAVVTGGTSSKLVLSEAYSTDPLGDFIVNSNRQITFANTPVRFSGVQRVDLQGASGFVQATNNNFVVHSWDFGPRLYVYGSGAYQDRLTLDTAVADNAGALITFNGATHDGGSDSGAATLTIDDSANDGGLINGGEEHTYVPKTFSISELGVFSNAVGGFHEFDLANITNINIYLGRGAPLGDGPEVFVDGERAGQNISIYGNNPNDISFASYFIGSTDPHGFPELSSPFSDAILGNVFLYGNGGANALTIDDRDHATAAGYTLTGNSLHSNAGGGTVYWDGVNFPEVDFYGSNAGSSMTVSGFDSTVPVRLFGGTSLSDVLTVDDRAMANRRPNRFDLYADRVTRFFPTGPAFETVYYNGYEALNGYLNALETTTNIYGVPALPPGQQATFTGGSNAELFTVYPRDAAGNMTILGNVGIIGGAGADVLNISDTLAAPAAGGATWTVNNPFGATTQDFEVWGDALVGALNDVETVDLNGSGGDDTFNVNTYKAGNACFVNAGAGNDTLNFGNNSLVSNITSIAGFNFDGQAGTDTFNLMSAGDGSGTYTRTNFNPSIGLTSFVNQFGTYNITVLDAGTELMQIYPAPTGPAVNVNGVIAGTTTAVHFNSPSSPGVLRLGSGTGTLTGINGAVVFDGGASGSSIAVNDSADTVGRVAHLTQTSLGMFPGDTLFPAGGSLTFTHIVAGFTPALTFNCGSGADTIYAAPNPTGTITITGGNPTAAPGDTIDLALAGAQGYALHGTAASGNVTSTNLKTLTYSGFESGPNVDAVPPAVAGANFNVMGEAAAGAPAGGPLAAAAIVPGLDVQFSEDVALLLASGSISLTNTTTGQAVPQGAVVVTYDPTTRTAHFTFPGYPGGILPDGVYQGTIVAGAAGDLFGNPLAATPVSFFVLAGDANRDRTVNFSDLLTLARNYNKSGMTFADGDFNYDGVVNFNDLLALARNYNKSLPAPLPAVSPVVAPAIATAPVSASRVASDEKRKAIFSTTPVVVAKPAPSKAKPAVKPARR